MLIKGTFSCGHEGYATVFGTKKERRWREETVFLGVCPDCYKKSMDEKRAEENKAALEELSQLGFPALVGSAKQVAWANTIRLKFYHDFSEYVKTVIQKQPDIINVCNEDFNKSVVINRLMEIQQYAMTEKLDAKFWIDNRNLTLTGIAHLILNDLRQRIPEEVQEEIDIQEAECTVVPEGHKKDGIVKISQSGNFVYVKYIKDDEFRKIIKQFHFHWEDGCWQRKMSEYTGPIEERIAEVGNHLLSAGFTVRFPDALTRDNAVAGIYNLEPDKWIQYNAKQDKLAIKWYTYDDTLYQEAKKLPGAKWYAPTKSILVPMEFYHEVADFSQMMGFVFSKKATEVIDNFKSKEAQFRKEKISQHVTEDSPDRLRMALERAGIIEDLKDEA